MLSRLLEFDKVGFRILKSLEKDVQTRLYDQNLKSFVQLLLLTGAVRLAILTGTLLSSFFINISEVGLS
jgi:hypothetical protein